MPPMLASSVARRALAAVLALAMCLGAYPAQASSPAGDSLLSLLDRVRIVAAPGYHPGYDRSCDPGACVFGSPWTDAHAGPYGHNGCTTREDVLLRQMRHIEMRWGSDCRIYQAKLRDPYTGERLNWRDDGYFIQIDHVYPLSRAWHEGAWAWTQRRRVRFANDVERELWAVSARANQAKLGATPAQWMPPWRRTWCRYLRAYLKVAKAYDLPVTAADARVVRRVAPTC
jgi:hypothetical protein